MKQKIPIIEVRENKNIFLPLSNFYSRQNPNIFSVKSYQEAKKLIQQLFS